MDESGRNGNEIELVTNGLELAGVGLGLFENVVHSRFIPFC